VLIPLLRAGGIGPSTAGALLLLGCSMGGELYNPGAVEVVTLAGLTDSSPAAVVSRTVPPNLIACVPALLAFWWLAVRRGRDVDEVPIDSSLVPSEDAPFRVNLFKAMVPLIPLALLFAVPNLLPPPRGAERLSAQAHQEALERTRSATIMVAMLVGVAAAGLTGRREAGRLATAFFEGAGYGFTHVISLIVTASTFADGLKAIGLIDALASGLARLDASASLLVSIALPWSLASISGSGIAPAVAVMKALVPQAQALGFVPTRLGTIIALSAHFGRTMSPVAAVVFMCSNLSGAPTTELVRRVAPALIVGGMVLFVVAWMKII
jgi:DcuC family C4-dicarboxylate transporter